MNLEIGNKYKWKHETQRLVYVGSVEFGISLH